MILNIISVAICLILSKHVQAAAQSSLYPDVDSTRLAKAFNISLGCLDALNETVSCDATLLRMAGDVDNYLWDVENITALCTVDCLSTASIWFSGVLEACSDDYMNVRGRLVPPYTIPGRVLDGMNFACLRSDTDVSLLPGVNGDEITIADILGNSTDTTNTTIPTPTDTAGLRGNLDQLYSNPPEIQPTNNTHISQHQTATRSGTGYCLIDSYSWVGSDIIRPDCSDSTSTDPQCLDPTNVPEENQRIANLYPDELLCNDCFIKIFYLRVASPYLPVLDYSDYLIEQYLDIVDVCDATVPELFVRIDPQYDYANNTWNGSSEYNGTSRGSSMACGQNLTMTDLQAMDFPDPSVDNRTFCDTLSAAYNVTTGDLQVAFDDPFCTPQENFTSMCLPAKCSVIEIPYNTTCASVAKQVSTAEANVTKTQLLSGTPVYKASATSYPPNTFAQQRGGSSRNSTSDRGAIGGSRNATIVPIGGIAPSPTQPGISPTCTEYAVANKGDNCDSLARLWHVIPTDFFAWNKVLGPNGENCDTQLFLNYYYCIGVLNTPPSTSSMATSTMRVAPGPTQSGIISTCNNFAKSIPGLGCEDFAAANGITSAQLYAWNPTLGINGAACVTEFWAGEYYCVGVSS